MSLPKSATTTDGSTPQNIAPGPGDGYDTLKEFRGENPRPITDPWPKLPLDGKIPVPKADPLVEHPKHYNFSKFEVIDVLQAWFAHNALLWQVVKYCARAEHKGHYRQDLEKAEFYLKQAIAEAKTDEAQEAGG